MLGDHARRCRSVEVELHDRSKRYSNLVMPIRID
jgi:hypothetical protein